MNKQALIITSALLVSFTPQTFAQYPGWQHQGPLFILTTPDGANLPATASEDNFPLLIRLNQRTFDFSQAKPNGEDLRFSAAGKPLAYQIEEWDAGRGVASIWVRIPLIKGKAVSPLIAPEITVEPEVLVIWKGSPVRYDSSIMP
jgi:hypothetical protein